MRGCVPIGPCLLGLLVLSSIDRVVAAPDPEQAAAALFDTGSAALNRVALPEATQKFEALLKDFPRSKYAPEAAYKLACAYVLQGRCDDAKLAFVRLPRDFFNSPWGQLSALLHLDPKQLGDLANEKREQARQPGGAEAAVTALRLYQVYGIRFLCCPQPPAGAMARAEVQFKMADCLHHLGQDREWRAGLVQVRDQDKDGNWGKLAALYLGDTALPAAVKDFPALNTIGNEAWTAFLEVSDRHLAGLHGDDNARCLCCRAYCLAGLNRAQDAAAVRRTVIRDFAGSASAADCAFWLAEEDFRAGRRAEAKAAFLDLAAKYPNSPRTATVRRWAAWVDEGDAAWKEVAGVLTALIGRVSQPGTGFAFTLRTTSAAGRPILHARLAIQDSHHTFLEISCGDSTLLLVNTPEGTWYHGPDQATVLHLPQPMDLPVPRLAVTVDPVAQTFSANGNLVPEAQSPGQPLLSLPSALAPLFVAKARDQIHLHREVRKSKDGCALVTFQIEYTRFGRPEPDVATVTLGDGGKIREIELAVLSDDKPMRWTLTDLVLGEKLPADRFHFTPPAGTSVKNVAVINPFEIMAAVMKLVQALAADAQAAPKS
jgi:hypothetical protein